MKALTETVKKILDALACADAGEYLNQRDKFQILNQKINPMQTVAEIPATVTEDAGSSTRRVALYLGSELPAEVMDYVIQTCSRLQHDLTVLTFESENTGRALLQPYENDLATAGVDYKLVNLFGDHPMTGLKRYLRRHSEIAFLACKDSGYLGHMFLNGNQRNNVLPVPVVVVTTEAEGAGKLGQPSLEQNNRDTVIA